MGFSNIYYTTSDGKEHAFEEAAYNLDWLQRITPSAPPSPTLPAPLPKSHYGNIGDSDIYVNDSKISYARTWAKDYYPSYMSDLSYKRFDYPNAAIPNPTYEGDNYKKHLIISQIWGLPITEKSCNCAILQDSNINPSQRQAAASLIADRKTIPTVVANELKNPYSWGNLRWEGNLSSQKKYFLFYNKEADCVYYYQVGDSGSINSSYSYAIKSRGDSSYSFYTSIILDLCGSGGEGFQAGGAGGAAGYRVLLNMRKLKGVLITLGIENHNTEYSSNKDSSLTLYQDKNLDTLPSNINQLTPHRVFICEGGRDSNGGYGGDGGSLRYKEYNNDGTLKIEESGNDALNYFDWSAETFDKFKDHPWFFLSHYFGKKGGNASSNPSGGSFVSTDLLYYLYKINGHTGNSLCATNGLIGHGGGGDSDTGGGGASILGNGGNRASSYNVSPGYGGGGAGKVGSIEAANRGGKSICIIHLEDNTTGDWTTVWSGAKVVDLPHPVTTKTESFAGVVASAQQTRVTRKYFSGGDIEEQEDTVILPGDVTYDYEGGAYPAARITAEIPTINNEITFRREDKGGHDGNSAKIIRIDQVL